MCSGRAQFVELLQLFLAIYKCTLNFIWAVNQTLPHLLLHTVQKYSGSQSIGSELSHYEVGLGVFDMACRFHTLYLQELRKLWSKSQPWSCVLAVQAPHCQRTVRVKSMIYFGVSWSAVGRSPAVVEGQQWLEVRCQGFGQGGPAQQPAQCVLGTWDWARVPTMDPHACARQGTWEIIFKSWPVASCVSIPGWNILVEIQRFYISW